MKKIFASITAFVVAVAIIAGCKKDRIEQQQNAYEPVNTYLDSKKQQEQEFTVDSGGSGPITGNQGTQIWIGKQCLMYPNGDSVTWPFTVKLVELYTPKDMIYYQEPTITSSGLLRTDGEIRLRAFKGATELLLKPDPCLAAIAMPCAAPQAGQTVFYGFGNSTPSTDWSDNPTDFGITTSLSPNFTTTASSYTASIARLGWINCGKKAGGSSNSTCTFSSSTDDLTNVGIFIYFPATKSVMQVSGTGLVSSNIPNGTSAKIICIGIDASGNLFDYYQAATVNSNMAIDVVMTATTDAALTTLLDGL